MIENVTQQERHLPRPVPRERAGVRESSNPEHRSSHEPTLTPTLSRRTGRGSRNGRHGIIFIAALGVIIILTGLVLVFAQSMRTESLAAANRLSYLQADAVEQGAEKWVMANVEANTSDALTITQLPANALQLDNGYFWCLNPDPDSDQIYQYGIVDESSKLNVNVANATQLQALPNVTDEIAASIVTWVGASTSNTASSSSGTAGADNSYYATLAEPYSIKSAPYEITGRIDAHQGCRRPVDVRIRPQSGRRNQQR